MWTLFYCIFVQQLKNTLPHVESHLTAIAFQPKTNYLAATSCNNQVRNGVQHIKPEVLLLFIHLFVGTMHRGDKLDTANTIHTDKKDSKLHKQTTDKCEAIPLSLQEKQCTLRSNKSVFPSFLFVYYLKRE